MTSRWRALLISCGAAFAAAPLRADDPPADADFLEYLGSVDSNEAGWHEYLAATDVDKMAKPPSSSAVGSTPAAASPPPPPPQPATANPPTAPNTPRKVKQS
ncbi:MAG: hypothetical protein ACREPP_09130 [Rhodanobacteraceae bacterium]